MTTFKRVIISAMLVAAAFSAGMLQAERSDIYVERGTGYTLIYSDGTYVVGYGIVDPTARTAFGTSGHVIPDNSLFYRTDLGTFKSISAGTWSATSFAGQTFTASTFTSPTITTPAISAPVLSGSATGTYTLAGTPTITAPTITAPVITGIVTDPTTTVNVGAEAVTNMTVTENGDGAVHRTDFTFAAHSVTMTDAAAAGNHGSVPIYTFSQGFISIHASFCNLTTLAGAGGIADTAALVLSIGSVVVATDNATLTGTEADIIASFAGTLSSGAGVFTKQGDAIAASFDGHTTSEAIFLNLAVPDADSTASDTLALSGTCSIIWSNIGDF